VLVLQVILTIQALPPLYKELFTELEWVQQTIKLAADEQFKNYFGLENVEVDPYWS
jgi:sensor domain CHASE-containing protein